VDAPTALALKRRSVPALPPDSLAKLVAAGVLHDGNQRTRIQGRFDLNRFATTHINITLAPTIECNLACWYCYQNNRRYIGAMDQATQDATLDFIAAVTIGKASFNVDWYGGEPLLARDVIRSMTARIRTRFCNGTPHYTGGGIVTNGLLLDRETVDMLVAAGVNRAQVSIDRLVHRPPKERGLVDDLGEPSPILVNLLAFQDTLGFGLRINLAALPPGELDAIETTLRQYGLDQIARLARAEDNVAECSAPRRGTVPDGLMSRKDYARAEARFGRGTQAQLDVMQDELTPRSSFCGATNGGLYVIDHKGDVSRCYMSAGVAGEKIGNVRDLARVAAQAVPTGEAADQAWRQYTPFDYQSCRECRVLPLCMGGCSHARVLHDGVHPPCESIKHNITTYVREISRRLPDRPVA
jgi:uncharacterized protein